MSVVVFVGPTLDRDAARRILDADYRPPASMGDVWRAVHDAYDAIVIIDGVFERSPAVWHKEVLFALSRGVRVFGAASMGALRATELECFGMEGVGRIFELFRDGTLEDDDEVCVAHATEEHAFRCLSDAMVNIRHGLALAEAQGLITTTEHAGLEAHAKAQFYADRTWASVFDAPAARSVSRENIARLRALIASRAADLKRIDAMAVLEHVKMLGSPLERRLPSFELEISAAWRKLMAKETRPTTREVTASAIASHVRATMPARREILRASALHELVAMELRRRTGEEPSLTDIDEACERVASQHRDRVDCFVALELARRDQLEQIAAHVERKWSSRPVGERERCVEETAIRAWYETRFGPLDGDPDDHAGSLGFDSWDALAQEIAAEMRFDSSSGRSAATRQSD